MTNEEGLDRLQAAVVAVNDTGADLVDLASQDEELLEYCQSVCGRLLTAKRYVSTNHPDGEEPDEEIVEFIKFLQFIKENNDVSAFEHEMLTEDVSVYTARRCLEHVLSQNYQSPILQPFAPSTGSSSVFDKQSGLPSQSNEKLVKDMVMIMHARQCDAEDCGHKYCKNMKDFLAQADTLTWDEAEAKSGDFLYLKQLEKHFNECNKASCYYCSTVNEALESQKEVRVRVSDSTESMASNGSQASSKKGRSSRSVSMPPRPDALTMQQMMYSNPYVWPQYSMGYYQQMPMYPQQYGMSPMMQQQPGMVNTSQLQVPEVDEEQTLNGKGKKKTPASRLKKKSRLKAYSTPIKPNIEMDDEDDSQMVF